MRRRDALLAVLVAVIWGGNFVAVDIGLRTFPPFLFVALRYLLTMVPMLFVPRPRVRVRYLAAVGLLLGVGQFGLLFLGMSLGMPPGLSSLVLQCQAIFTLVFGLVLLRERPTGHQLAGLVVASAGIAVIAVDHGLSAPLVPFLLVVAAGAAWGAGNIATRRARADNPFALLVWSSAFPPLPMLALSAAFEGPVRIAHSLTHLSWSGVGALLYVVLLATLVGYGIWLTLLHRYPAAAVAPFSLLAPVVGVLAAWLIVGETASLAELGGGVLVLLGLAVLNRVFRRRSGT